MLAGTRLQGQSLLNAISKSLSCEGHCHCFAELSSQSLIDFVFVTILQKENADHSAFRVSPGDRPAGTFVQENSAGERPAKSPTVRLGRQHFPNSATRQHLSAVVQEHLEKEHELGRVGKQATIWSVICDLYRWFE